jgi:hypothetical protein
MVICHVPPTTYCRTNDPVAKDLSPFRPTSPTSAPQDLSLCLDRYLLQLQRSCPSVCAAIPSNDLSPYSASNLTTLVPSRPPPLPKDLSLCLDPARLRG